MPPPQPSPPLLPPPPSPYQQGNKSNYDAANLDQAAALFAAGAIQAQTPQQQEDAQQQQAFDATQRMLGLHTRDNGSLPLTGVSAAPLLQWEARTHAPYSSVPQ